MRGASAGQPVAAWQPIIEQFQSLGQPQRMSVAAAASNASQAFCPYQAFSAEEFEINDQANDDGKENGAGVDGSIAEPRSRFQDSDDATTSLTPGGTATPC